MGWVYLYFELFINGFGQFGPNTNVPWEAKGQLLALTLSTFVAQEYFTHTLLLIHKHKIIYPLFVALLGLASLGVAQTTIFPDIRRARKDLSIAQRPSRYSLGL
ncbi:hypothetical protein C8R47DRAFT_1323420 [Mycena vitilis]|nr:hypothetical protein C8R47DRAFT_1323420 [Mycena vitilis]